MPLEEWLQLPDIYTRPVMSDTHGRQTPPPEMDERLTRHAMRGREIGPLDLPTRGRGKMPQATFVPQSRGMLNIGFDDYVRQQSAQIAADDARERLYREQQGAIAKAAFARLLGILRGEQPTRESTEEWMTRKNSRGMLDRIDGLIPRPGPVRPKTPPNGGTRG